MEQEKTKYLVAMYLNVLLWETALW